MNKNQETYTGESILKQVKHHILIVLEKNINFTSLNILYNDLKIVNLEFCSVESNKRKLHVDLKRFVFYAFINLIQTNNPSSIWQETLFLHCPES